MHRSILTILAVLCLASPISADAQEATTTGIEYGETSITLTLGNLIVRIPATVMVPSSAIDTLLVTPSDVQMEIGDQRCLRVRVVTLDGDTVPGSAVNTTFTWESSNPDVATVVSGGEACISDGGG